MQIPGWLMLLVFVVLVGGMWLALMRAVIIPATNWLFDRLDRRLRRRWGIPDREDDNA